MSEKERSELKAILREAFGELVQPKLEEVERKLTMTLRRRNLALATAALCLIAAAFSAGYALNSRQQLDDQLRTNLVVVCGTARSTALSFREQQIREPKEHYLERLLAQRATLLAAGYIRCPSIPGFETFPFLRAQALAEIDRIIRRLAPRRFRFLPPRDTEGAPTRRLPSAPPDLSFSPPPPIAATSPAEPGGGESEPTERSPRDPPSREPKPKPKEPSGAEDRTPPTGTGATPVDEASPDPPPPAAEVEEPKPEPAPEAKPSGGLLGDPGGAVGELLCSANRLGLEVCTPR